MCPVLQGWHHSRAGGQLYLILAPRPKAPVEQLPHNFYCPEYIFGLFVLKPRRTIFREERFSTRLVHSQERRR